MADTDGDWVPKPYVSGEARPRGEGSIFDPARKTGETEGPKAFVTGWPVWHSRSPMIHGSWLKDLGLAGSYRRVGVPPEEIGDFFRTLKASGYVGGNVTIPHKVAALQGGVAARCRGRGDRRGQHALVRQVRPPQRRQHRSARLFRQSRREAAGLGGCRDRRRPRRGRGGARRRARAFEARRQARRDRQPHEGAGRRAR